MGFSLKAYTINRQRITAAQVAMAEYAKNEWRQRTYTNRTVLMDLLYLIGQELDDDFRGDARAWERFAKVLHEITREDAERCARIEAQQDSREG